MTETPEPKGKLDTMTTLDATEAAAIAAGERTRGRTSRTGTRWTGGQAEENVRRLRQRIFAASQAGDLKKVRNLQKLMLRSRSNALVRCGG